MKKILLILGLAILIVSTNELYAWTEPTLAPPNGNVLAPLRLDASGYLVLPSASRIGIGLTPSYGVDVSGTMRASSAVLTPLLRPTTGSLNISGSGWGMIFSIDTDANSPDIYSFLSDGTEIMSLAGSGASALELTSTGPASLTINADTDNVTETDNASVIFRQDAGAVIGRVGFRSNTNAFEVINQYADSLQLGTSNTIAATINSAGNLGLGITTPAHKLDVVGDINVTGCLRVDGACISAGGGTVGGSGTAGRLPLWSNGTTLGDSVFFQQNNSILGKASSWRIGDINWPGALEVHNVSWDTVSNNNYGTVAAGTIYSYGGLNSGGANGTEASAGQLYVAGESNLMGNVGVGTTNPVYDLDVSGSMQVTNGTYSTTITGTGISTRSLSANNNSGSATILGVNYSGAAVQGAGNGASAYGIYGSNSNSSGYGVWCNSGRCGGSSAWVNSSDERLKENIKTISAGLDKVMQLRGVQYEWKKDDTNKKNIGFIAQEVMEVVPEVVMQNTDGYYTLSESSISAVLVEAVKELKAENDDLRERLEKLEAKIK